MNAQTNPPTRNVLTLLTALHRLGLHARPIGQDLAKPAEWGKLRRVVALTSCGLVLASVALNSPKSQAAETSAAAASALKVLSMPLNETRGDSTENTGTTGPAAQKEGKRSTSSGPSITVQKGESIDAVIRRGMPRLPLRDDVMRQALAKANPRIFPRGQTYPVKPGTVLTLPSLDELRQMITTQYPEMLLLLQTSSAENLPDEGPKGPDKSRWVRFP